MKYLITGGCGFLGSNLALEILSKGEELYILDNFLLIIRVGLVGFVKKPLRQKEVY